ncbi:porin [Ramlibacter sp. 2FC]|uniref:porin n=1 Tax=Ramlibacter sp. 2FC TaxID=2502188 RepID=UPI0010F8435E|nr:porin [Ramlibacter sp. 2FC]
MKKSLIALAVLAASGAAMAQSSVTLSGNINLGVVKNSGSSAKLDAANGATQIKFAGTEDLGGGLKATFALAQRLSPESGGNDGTLNQRPTFQGESTVGLAGNFGAVKLGRQLTALQGPVNATDPWGTWTVGSTANLASGYSTDPRQADGAGAGRTDAITYASPSFAGFSVAASLGLKNSAGSVTSTSVVNTADAGSTTDPVITTTTAGSTQAKNLGSIWLTYANGPVMIGGGFEQNRRDDEVGAILGTYDFGIVKLGAGYSQVDTVAIAGEKRKNWNLMASAPFGQFTVKAGYNNSKAEGTELKTTKYGIGGEYALSKRTYLYTTFGRSKTDGATAVKGFDIGMNHAF